MQYQILYEAVDLELKHLHLPAGHGLDCRSARLRLQMAKNMRTTQHNWPGKKEENVLGGKK